MKFTVIKLDSLNYCIYVWTDMIKRETTSNEYNKIYIHNHLNKIKEMHLPSSTFYNKHILINKT